MAESAETRLRQQESARQDSRRSAPPSSGFGSGRGPSDHKRKTLDSSMTSRDDKKIHDTFGGRESGNSGRVGPICPKCSKNHRDDYVIRACFKCEGIMHFKKDFPQMKRHEQGSLPGLPIARGITLSKANTEESPLVVTG